MLSLVLASAIYAASFQSAATNGARDAFRTCIKDAAEQAKQQKVSPDGFPAFVGQQCTAQAAKFKSALWAFDSKNKVPRSQSEEDADLQLEDVVLSIKDRYEAELTPQ